MRYVSLFSGVEAATVAWSRLGWQPLAFAEVDEFPVAVLAHRFPNVPNLGDVCNIDWKEFNDTYGAVDVLIGGSPCQSFSIAGGREGLQGESRLMYEYVRAVRELVRASGGTSPRYIVWENVPGCLSSNKGRDFGCLLDELEECGYFVAWRTLDSQFARVLRRECGEQFGPVPQRRRRVYLVGSLGGPSAADILFERSCMRGDHPKGRKAREAIARRSESCPRMGDCAGFKYHQGANARDIGYEDELTPTITADYHQPAVLTPWDVQSKRVNTTDGTSPTLPSGTGEGMNIQPVVITTANTNANGSNVNEDGVSYTIDGANSNAVAFAQNTRDEVRIFGGDGQVVGALSAQPGMKQTSYVCMQDGQAKGGISDDVSTTLNSSHEQPIVIDRAAFNQGENAQYDPHIEQGGGHGRIGCARPACCMPSNGGDVIGPLCARDHKGVGSEYVSEGKVICQVAESRTGTSTS